MAVPILCADPGPWKRASPLPRLAPLDSISMTTTSADLELDAAERDHVRRALSVLRTKNAIGVAWFRLLARSLLLAIYGGAWVRGSPTTLAASLGTALNGVALAIAIPVLVLLVLRPAHWVAFAGAASDVVLVGLEAFFVVQGAQVDPAHTTALYAAGFQVVLLFSALTCAARHLAILSGAAWVASLGLAIYGGLSIADALVLLVIVGVFGATISMVGSRFVFLAARAAAEARSAREARRHGLEMLEANKALRAVQAEAEALSAVIVHDLRNPLASIWANLEEVRDTLPSSNTNGREAIDSAVEELRRVSDMTGDLLLVTRLENRPTLPTSTVSVDELFRDLERAFAPLVRRAGASFEWRRTGDAPAKVPADPQLIRRVFDNLLTNAARHVGKGDRVEVIAERDGDRLRLAVRNSGPPVPSETRARLFEKHATSRGRGWANVGLGLYMCRLVAEQHGGSIALVDRPGWNVSFEVTLPVVPGLGSP
ncbi:MAG TPA: HAMP domain-containing sensor histidine kinase [Candidatus Methylomirabilis sp.]|nr:HAMP domain-containing sensor histidine kinase [Candidatus Methylomirabilis sp.]